ncbi:MAG: [FeFe] hydrogenase H-cluster maturation GTPase HydF [Christensenellaceae bacterium]|nr:[FeFe] hydrogenase H-cluster maturation GTPase HydF [Christensenellaceae bacterium]
MSLNATASGERLHIAFFGLRNVGKSSLVNAVTGQNLSIVSDIKGTTTDPVQKAMELLPIGPVLIIDTPGIDDDGTLGELRVEKTRNILGKTDVAVLVSDANKSLQKEELALIDEFKTKKIPYIITLNKTDLLDTIVNNIENSLLVSAKTGEGIFELKKTLGKIGKKEKNKQLLGDLINTGDMFMLVTPIDESAPKGRLILPQQQTIREILDNNAIAIVSQVNELSNAISSLSQKPKMIITDSQVFGKVAQIVPEDIPLTSFSILFARYKYDLATVVKGAIKLDNLLDNDTILISEGCTHHRQCDDIGTVKIPNWVKKHSGKQLNFEFTSGGEFPKDLSKYSLIIHCGACMLNDREMNTRMTRAIEQGVPFTNYGVAIAQMHGILKRSVTPFNISI